MLPERYSASNISRALSNPQILVDEVGRLYSSFSIGIRRRLFHLRYGPPVNPMSTDWDYLIILDACRYDALRDYFGDERQVEAVISNGSHSEEYIQNTILGNTHFDTVYVTANGWVAKRCKNVFHNLIFTDIEDATQVTNFTHPSWHGLAPETVKSAALEAYELYPNKRLIVHFMQPHAPYFGQSADKLRDRLDAHGYNIHSRNLDLMVSSKPEESLGTLTEAARRGYIDHSELKEVYAENLEIVMEHVDDLLQNLDGKIVITADHGEFLGERIGLRRRSRYGHSRHCFNLHLRQVPWVEINSDTRPEITAEPPNSPQDIEEEHIEERLEVLGYI